MVGEVRHLLSRNRFESSGSDKKKKKYFLYIINSLKWDYFNEPIEKWDKCSLSVLYDCPLRRIQ